MITVTLHRTRGAHRTSAASPRRGLTATRSACRRVRARARAGRRATGEERRERPRREFQTRLPAFSPRIRKPWRRDDSSNPSLGSLGRAIFGRREARAKSSSPHRGLGRGHGTDRVEPRRAGGPTHQGDCFRTDARGGRRRECRREYRRECHESARGERRGAGASRAADARTCVSASAPLTPDSVNEPGGGGPGGGPRARNREGKRWVKGARRPVRRPLASGEPESAVTLEKGARVGGEGFDLEDEDAAQKRHGGEE